MAVKESTEAEELLWTCAMARLIFGPHMSIQSPPNLRCAGREACLVVSSSRLRSNMRSKFSYGEDYVQARHERSVFACGTDHVVV